MSAVDLLNFWGIGMAVVGFALGIGISALAAVIVLLAVTKT